ncbi:MAG: bifunctional 3-hydroxydecanoyl-ACP dehydratase/trans-2-decenoyl-ACP isomerase [Deltaproteobacteria bacterium]|nr:bifunctional 3-hydroxydecanoyl-ACP dehydratase/trans-2-decenoyl-ACP isomerase [Deltaproteobacteria bacterium]
MKYAEFLAAASFSRADLLAFAHGNLIEDPPEGFAARLPAPPLLMLDRVTEFVRKGSRGRAVAECDVNLDDWFFQCHFIGDPVQPGCLGVDGVWQLLGLYCNWAGGVGSGRALGCGEVEFYGQIRPHDKLVRYEVDIRRFAVLPDSGSVIVIGDAILSVDDEPIYSIKRAKVGLFTDLSYSDYPHASANARGGRLER